MVRLISRYLIAVAAGWFVAGSVLRLLALIAAAPGLRALIEAIRAAGLPLPYIYPLLTNYIPVFLFAFIVGMPLFKFVGGNRGWLLAAAVLPWAAHVAYWYFLFCIDPDVTCVGASPFHEIMGRADVPIGFAIAALVTRPRSPPSPNMLIDTDGELVSVSLTLLPNGESGQWDEELGRPRSSSTASSSNSRQYN